MIPLLSLSLGEQEVSWSSDAKWEANLFVPVGFSLEKGFILLWVVNV